MRPDPTRISLRYVRERKADLSPPLGYPGGPCHLMERVDQKVRSPRRREDMIQDIEEGEDLSRSEQSALYKGMVVNGASGTRFKKIFLTQHVQYRMDQRGVVVNDIRNALRDLHLTWANEKSQGSWTYRRLEEDISSGRDFRWVDSQGLAVVLALTPLDPKRYTARVVTTYWEGVRDPRPFDRERCQTFQGWSDMKMAGVSDWLRWVVQPFQVLLKHSDEFVNGPVDEAMDEVIRDLAPEIVEQVGERYVDALVDEFDLQVTERTIIQGLQKAWSTVSPRPFVKNLLGMVRQHGWKLGLVWVVTEILERLIPVAIIALTDRVDVAAAVALLPINEVVLGVVLKKLGRSLPDQVDPDGHLDWYVERHGPVRLAGTWGYLPWDGDGQRDHHWAILEEVDPKPAYDKLLADLDRLLKQKDEQQRLHDMWAWVGTFYLTAESLWKVPRRLAQKALEIVKDLPDQPGYEAWVETWKAPSEFPKAHAQVLKDLEETLGRKGEIHLHTFRAEDKKASAGRVAVTFTARSLGDCYEVNGRWFMENALFPGNKKSLRLVHGEVTGQGPLEGIKYGHCWVEDGGTVIDKSNGRDLRLPKGAYYAMGRIGDNLHVYKPEEFRRKVMQYEHWGPWDLRTESGL